MQQSGAYLEGNLKGIWLPPRSFLDHSLCWKPATMSWRHSSSPVKRTTYHGTEASQPKASTNLPAMWVIHLESGASRPSQVFRWLQPETPKARTMQLSCSWIPDSAKLCEINNVYCYFKMLHFRVICGVPMVFESLYTGFETSEVFLTCFHIGLFWVLCVSHF